MLSQLCFQTAFLVASAHSVFLVHALDTFCMAVRCLEFTSLNPWVSVLWQHVTGVLLCCVCVGALPHGH